MFFAKKSNHDIVYFLISVNPSRVENIAKILSKQNVKQSNTADSLWGLGKHWHDARQIRDQSAYA